MNSFSMSLPLMIPSFSSKGNVFIRQDDGKYVSDNYSLLLALNTRLSKTYLVSAYDVFYGLMPQDPCDWPQTEYLFIDSGGYEINQSYETTERNRFNFHVEEWTPAKMEEVYRRVVESQRFQMSTIILSTFDYEGSFIEQLERAETLQCMFPGAIINFLVKINFSIQHLANELKDHISRLNAFKVLGFTEKELGNTVRERITNLLLLKRVLLLSGWKGNIHLFGGLDPLLSPMYNYAGVDIFDGLSWQRERYSTCSTLIDHAFYDLSISEQENRYEMMKDNLVFLQDLSNDLSVCSQGNEYRMLKIEQSLKKSSIIAEILEELEMR